MSLGPYPGEVHRIAEEILETVFRMRTSKSFIAKLKKLGHDGWVGVEIQRPRVVGKYVESTPRTI